MIRQLLGLSEEVARRVRERRFLAKTIGIKIRFADFTTVTRVRTLPARTDVTSTVYETALGLYRSLELDQPRIRLVGVRCESLAAADEVSEQLSFDDLQASPAPRATDVVLDEARRRFGAGALRYATLLGAPEDDPVQPNRLSVRDE